MFSDEEEAETLGALQRLCFDEFVRRSFEPMLKLVQHLSLRHAGDTCGFVEEFHMLFEVHAFGRAAGELLIRPRLFQLVERSLPHRRFQLLLLQLHNCRHHAVCGA